MPELPEAETIARELDRQVVGCVISSVRVLRRDVVHGDPRPIGRVVTGRHIRRVYRRAKRVIVAFDPPIEIVFHLGMSGRLSVEPSRVLAAKHTHLRLALDDDEVREIRFCDPRRFGGVWVLAGGTRQVGRKLGPLGPEPLQLTSKDFANILDRNRQVKALLLDQGAIAGIGNIYCDEALFRAGVHPLTSAADLSLRQRGVLLHSIKTVLRAAIKHRGSTISDYRQVDGVAGSFQHSNRVYGREGTACVECSAEIIRLVAAGRSTFVCAVCQPQQSM